MLFSSDSDPPPPPPPDAIDEFEPELAPDARFRSLSSKLQRFLRLFTFRAEIPIHLGHLEGGCLMMIRTKKAWLVE